MRNEIRRVLRDHLLEDCHGSRRLTSPSEALRQLVARRKRERVQRDGSLRVLDGLLRSSGDVAHVGAPLVGVGEADSKELGFNPARLLHKLQRTVFNQQEKYGKILRDEVLPLLEANGIFIPRGDDISQAQRDFVADYFKREVEPHLGPIALESDGEVPTLENRGIYLVVELWPMGNPSEAGGLDFALVHVPSSASAIPRLA